MQNIPVKISLDRQKQPSYTSNHRKQCLINSISIQSVLNGGVDNYGPWQERIFLEERCLPLKPTLVLHELFPGNDIENSLAKIGKYPRAYNRESKKWSVESRNQSAFPLRAEDWLHEHCMAYKLAVRAEKLDSPLASLLWRCRFAGPKPFVDLPASEPRPFNLEPCLREWYPALQEGWEIFEADTLATQELCARKNVDYIAFAIPEFCNILDGAWRWATRPLGQEAYDRHKDVRITEEFLTQSALPFIPLTAVMMAYPDRNKLYYGYDGHLTPEGAELVANELAKGLIERYLKRSMP
jgi:hypothetical protein